MWQIVLSCILAVLPASLLSERSGHCDLVEVNHCYDSENGKLKFTQLIAWDASPEYRRFDAQQWAMISGWEQTASGVLVKVDGTGLVLRLRCRYFRETWTILDPERKNLELFSEKHRRRVW